LGEALGMAIATTNRTLRDLRSAGSAEFRDGVLTIIDWEKLAKLGSFEPSYLHLKKIQPL
jgi:hypothetical protein